MWGSWILERSFEAIGECFHLCEIGSKNSGVVSTIILSSFTLKTYRVLVRSFQQQVMDSAPLMAVPSSCVACGLAPSNSAVLSLPGHPVPQGSRHWLPPKCHLPPPPPCLSRIPTLAPVPAVPEGGALCGRPPVPKPESRLREAASAGVRGIELVSDSAHLRTS